MRVPLQVQALTHQEAGDDRFRRSTALPADPPPRQSDRPRRTGNAVGRRKFLGTTAGALAAATATGTAAAAGTASAEDAGTQLEGSRLVLLGTAAGPPPERARVFPSYAFRFDTAEGSVVFSGDTTASDNVVRLAHGADILVHEVMDADFYREYGLPPARTSTTCSSPTPTSPKSARSPKRSGVHTLVLSHICPAGRKHVSSAEWRRRAGRGFSGHVIAGSDLQQIPLPGRRS